MSILDGPLDADKVAYLRTDAAMTGARFGQALDMDSLLGALTCFVDDEEATIGITDKGISAAEAIATARRWMYQRVYWHRSNRALMAMLRYPVQYAIEHGTLRFADYLHNVFAMTDVEAIRFVHTRFAKAAGDARVENPALAAVAGRRGIYKRFLEFPSHGDTKQHKIHDYLVHRTCKEWRSLAADIAAQLRPLNANVLDSDILLDIPVRDRPQLGDILVGTRIPGKYERLSAISEAYASTKEFFIKASMMPRVFIHPTILRGFAESQQLTSARTVAIEYLHSCASHPAPSKAGRQRLRVVKG
jgi:hypothetical protein